MIRTPCLALTLIAGAAACAPAMIQAPPPGLPAPGAVPLAEVDAAWRAHGAPGYVVAIAGPGGLLHLNAGGVRALGGTEPVRSDDVFHLGSISKPMTATLIATLVDEGRLGWESTPADIWPGWRSVMDARLARVTLAQLLGHRAGIQAFTDDAEFTTLPPFPGSQREQRLAFSRFLLTRPPASDVGGHVYSNAGYGIAAAMAEQAAGRSWERLMRERLFRPLGLASCHFGWPRDRSDTAPSGHRFRSGTWSVHDLRDGYRLEAIIDPAGDISCSARDLAEFGRAHLLGLTGRHPLLKPATWARLHQAPVEEYALGWNVQEIGSTHMGSADTFHAGLLVSPARKAVVVTLLNGAAGERNGAFISAAMSALLRRYAPAAPRPSTEATR